MQFIQAFVIREEGASFTTVAAPTNMEELLPYINQPNLHMMMLADHSLDPLQWGINRWVDPHIPCEQVTGLEDIFDARAVAVYESINPASQTAQVLRSFGLLTLPYPGQHPPITAIQHGISGVVGGEYISNRIVLEFDASLPIAAQLESAAHVLIARRGELVKMSGRTKDEFVEIQVADQRGRYWNYIDLLDVPAPPGTSDADIIRQLAKAPNLEKSDPKYDMWSKRLTQARELRDRGYLSLAFPPSSAFSEKRKRGRRG
ncbi:MAG: hypothetical protein V4684_10400 [Pseudomonadota bacterium]